MTEAGRNGARIPLSGLGLFLRSFLFFWTDPERNFRRCRRGQYLGLIRLMKEYGFVYDEEDRRIYFSQYGQDKFVAEHLLPGMRNGIFVDVGAYDGVTISNSCFFERERVRRAGYERFLRDHTMLARLEAVFSRAVPGWERTGQGHPR